MSIRNLLLLLWALLSLPLPAGAPPRNDAGFAVEAVSDAVFARMRGKSYRKGCPVARKDLRHLRLRYVDFEGRVRSGELVCHKAIAADLLSIFRRLYAARYPIGSVRLIDDYGADDHRSMAANNTSSFCHRPVAGSTRLSRHAYGRAVDINPLYNPHVTRRGRVNPPEGRPFADRTRRFAHKISHNDLCYKLFRAYGFSWGGDWRSSKDYQHFER